jgi:peptide methionine sulfoxide reductase MsrB
MKVFDLLLLLVTCVSYCNAGSWFGQDPGCTKPCMEGDESIMSPKEHGTSRIPVQSPLRWGCDSQVADQICNFNRHYAEYSGYWQSTSFLEEVDAAVKEGTPIVFYDSNTGKPLFRAPVNRSWEDFLKESRSHGWPSFRDDEVAWENVRVLPGGETVSVDGTHLGHNLPDSKGRRYCINLVSVAGNPNTSRR